MGKTIMGAVVSLDGYIAMDNDDVGPLFDWYGNGDVEWKWSEDQEDPCRSTEASRDFVQAVYPRIGAVVIGRRLFDETNGWGGVPAAGDHVFVVTHAPPTDWEFADTAPFTSFRSSGPSNEQGAAMLSASVAEYDIADVRPLFGEGTA